MAALLLAAGTALAPPAVAQEVPVFDQPLGPEDCVRIASQRNLDVLIAHDQMRQSEGRARQAWNGILPTFTASASYGFDRTEGPAVTDVGLVTGETDTDTRVLDLRLEQPLFSLQSWQSLRSARSTAGASRADVSAAGIDVGLAVKTRYYELLKAKRVHEVRLESVDLREQQLERAQTLFDVGSVAKNDVLQARVNLQQARLEEIQARNQVALERLRLLELMGLPVITDFEIVDDLEIGTHAAVDSATVWQEALERRPDLRAARLRYRASTLGLSAARAGRYPRLFGRLQRTYVDQGRRSNVVLFGSPESLTKRWSASAGVSWPLFDGLLTEGRVKEAKASRSASENQLRQAELAAALEIREAILNLREAQQSITAADEAVALAEENLKLAEERYQLGSGTLLELEEAQVNLVDARRALVEAEAAHKVGEAALDKARGRRLD